MITPANAIDHLNRADVQNALDPDTYRAITLVLAMLHDAQTQRDDAEDQLADVRADRNAYAQDLARAYNVTLGDPS